jgi:hypothetical protein
MERFVDSNRAAGFSTCWLSLCLCVLWRMLDKCLKERVVCGGCCVACMNDREARRTVEGGQV